MKSKFKAISLCFLIATLLAAIPVQAAVTIDPNFVGEGWTTERKNVVNKAITDWTQWLCNKDRDFDICFVLKNLGSEENDEYAYHDWTAEGVTGDFRAWTEGITHECAKQS